MPKQLNSRCKDLVASLIRYFELERENNGPLLPVTSVRERVSAALNLNISTVSMILQAVKNNTVLKSPAKKRRFTKRVTNTINLDTSAIRNVIYEMYKRRQHVTLSSLVTELRDKQLFNGCRMSLSSLLKDIGFKWKKDDPRRGLMELPNVAFKRVEFLRSYTNDKLESLYQFVFTDETWIFQNGTISRSWQDSNTKSVRTTKVDGKRYIILHAGNEDEFIDGAQAIFSSKTQLSDYHGEMNHENFLRWFENQLLKNLTRPSIIVLDNAPYHSKLLNKIPNTTWTKAAIQEWLTNNSIQFTNVMFKSELLGIVARNKPPQKYLIDDSAEQYGHKVLRLPPYHCIFNPIEHVWGIAKNYYNRHIGREGNTDKSCLSMWDEALKTVSPENWKNCIRHTEDEISKWYEREHIFDRQEILPVLINVNDDSDSEYTSESD